MYRIFYLVFFLITTNLYADKFDKIIEKPEQDMVNAINITRNLADKDTIIIGKFLATTLESRILADEIREGIKSLIINKPNLMPELEENEEDMSMPYFINDYTTLKQKNVSYVINGKMRFSDGIHHLELNVFDVLKGAKLITSNFSFKEEEKEIFTKQLTTQIYEFLTGEFGFFYGKLLYTVTERPGTKPFKRVVISETINNLIQATAFTNGTDITFNPRYCRENEEVFFVLQKPKRGAEMFVANRKTGEISKIPVDKALSQNSVGTIFAPSISLDCNKIVFSLASEGSTNLFLYDRESGKLKQITKGNGSINTAPSFFDNDKKIVFVSDRTGKPKIWQTKIDGSEQKVITKNDGNYYSPSISSDGDKIAFLKVKAGNFSLGIINLDGTKEENLHSAFLIENPSWTPIGKTIVFSMKKNRNDRSRIYSLSLNGREPEEIDALKGNLSEPRWIDEL